MRGNSDPTGALLLGILAGLMSFFKGFRVMREYKVISDTPRIPIRSAAMGFVHIRGQASSDKILSSPVSHTPCCFYRVEVDEWRSSGKSHSWQHNCTDMDGYRFYLADATGKILIDAHAADYDLPLTSTSEVDSRDETTSGFPDAARGGNTDLLQYVNYAQMHSISERVGRFVDKKLAKAGAAGDPQLQAKRDVFRQIFNAVPEAARSGQMPPADLMAKLANASGPLQDPEKEERRQMFLQYLQHKASSDESGEFSMKMPMTQPATGRYRLREYLVVPGQQYLIDGTCVENCPEESGAENSSTASMIAKGQNEPTFLISSKSDTELEQGLKRRALIMVLGGAVLALACLAGLLVHLKLF